MKYIIVQFGVWGLRFIYFFFKLIPTNPKKITYISRQQNQISLDFSLLSKEISKTLKGYQQVFLCKKLDGGVNASFRTKIFYVFHMFKQMYHIATSKIVILDSYDICISVLNHKKSLKVIQMWHSMGTMKRFGYAILGMEEGSNPKLAKVLRMHHNYDYIFASSDAYKEHLQSGFQCDINKILTYSLPRTDLLVDKDYKKQKKQEIYKVYPNLSKKKNVVYCPTFRKDETDFQKALDRLVEDFDFEHYNLILKLHPLSKVNITNPKVFIDHKFSSLDMLFIADYLISDYSCIIYEAAVLNVPLLFYNFDMDLYLKNRGIALDYYKELPGTISGDSKEIVAALNSQYDYAKLKKFQKKYVCYTKDSCKRIVDFLKTIL